MQIFQMTPHYTLVRFGDNDRFTQPLQYVEYMQGAFEDCAHEPSLWLISMNPKCRPIARTLLRTGPLVAAMVSPREVFRVALHVDANAIAVVRGEPGEDVSLTKHDHQAVKRFGETAGYLSIQFVDYLVISARDELRGPHFTSWRCANQR
jgi:DNA repair protein RadC